MYRDKRDYISKLPRFNNFQIFVVKKKKKRVNWIFEYFLANCDFFASTILRYFFTLKKVYCIIASCDLSFIISTYLRGPLFYLLIKLKPMKNDSDCCDSLLAIYRCFVEKTSVLNKSETGSYQWTKALPYIIVGKEK